jgi:hypothetical protein
MFLLIRIVILLCSVDLTLREILLTVEINRHFIPYNFRKNEREEKLKNCKEKQRFLVTGEEKF